MTRPALFVLTAHPVQDLKPGLRLSGHLAVEQERRAIGQGPGHLEIPMKKDNFCTFFSPVCISYTVSILETRRHKGYECTMVHCVALHTVYDSD